MGRPWLWHRSFVVLPFALVFGACSKGEGTGPDENAGGAGPTPMTCGIDADCDDRRFCNGIEVCEPDAPGADERGCLRGERPCESGEECDEGAGTCEFSCDVDSDVDGDGYDAEACGGDDCDDRDPNRYPGNQEVCDLESHDEDCDPATYGFRDQDGDGVGDAACCNVRSNGDRVCGSDCDDQAAGVNPTASETCDGLDNDCDGDVDEGVRVVYSVDADGDGFGSAALDADKIEACPSTKPEGYAADATDCDDTRQAVNPAAVEFCDAAGRDENCNGAVNEGCGCSAGETVPCCGSGIQQCDTVTGKFGACSITPTDEICDGVDNDCDGTIDEGFQCVQGSEATICTTSGGAVGTRECLASCFVDQCRAAEVCNGIDDDGDGLRDEDFECEQGRFGIACITSCGTNGTGVCSDTCDGVVACVAPAESCNYCDDNGVSGFSEEKLLLVALGTSEGDKMVNVIECAGDESDHGAVSCSTESSGGGSAFDLWTTLLDGTENFQSGTVWPLRNDKMGWGPIEVEFVIEVRGFGAGYDVNDMNNLNPIPRRGGFAISLTSTSSGDGSNSVIGGEGHISVEWNWGRVNEVQPDDIGEPEGPPANYSATVYSDGVLVRGRNGRLLGTNGAGTPFTPYLSQEDVLGEDTWAQLPFYLFYSPDDPTTPLVNEERLLVKRGKTGTEVLDLPDEGRNGSLNYSPLRDELPVGSPLSIAIGAYSAGIPYEARIKSWNFAPPTGPAGITTWVHHATVKRQKICVYQLGL